MLLGVDSCTLTRLRLKIVLHNGYQMKTALLLGARLRIKVLEVLRLWG